MRAQPATLYHRLLTALIGGTTKDLAPADFILRTAITGARGLYALLKLLPTSNKVVMISRQSDRPSRDFRMFAAEWRRRHPTTCIVMLCETMKPSSGGGLAYTRTVLRQMYHLATSRACVLDGYAISVSVLNHRPGLVVVQMWHALGAIKKFGYQTLDRPGGRPSWLARTMCMHRNYDYVLCGGPASVPVFAEAFDIDPERVLPLGLPRVDYILRKLDTRKTLARSQSLDRLALEHPEVLDDGRLRILYAPTFRTSDTTMFRAVAECFADSPHLLIIKPHDLDSSLIDQPKVVMAPGVNVLALLSLADVVITDYSAVAFEATLAGKPVYFFVPDIDEYGQRHGLNLDPLAAMPAITSRDITTIARWMDEGAYDTEALRAAMAPYLPSPAPGATARIANLLDSALLERSSS